VEVVVNAITAAIALVALVVSFRVARRQTAIQERLTAIEETRRAEEVEARRLAQVTASFQPRGPDSQLVVHNQGPATARDVEVEVEEGPGVPPVFSLEGLPNDLQPDQPMTFQVPVSMGEAAPLRVTVRWHDGAGGHEQAYTFQTHVI
jgi:hypothetical protein